MFNTKFISKDSIHKSMTKYYWVRRLSYLIKIEIYLEIIADTLLTGYPL